MNDILRKCLCVLPGPWEGRRLERPRRSSYRRRLRSPIHWNHVQVCTLSHWNRFNLYSGITLKQSKTIEKIQKWAVSMILNNWTLLYTVKCTLLGIEPLYLRRKSLALNFSLRTVKNPKHKDFFQPKHRPYNTRQATVVTYEENQVRSTRFKNSPLVALRRDLNEYNHNKTRSARDGFS